MSDIPANTQEMILQTLRDHGVELRGIHASLEQLIRVDEKQSAAELRLNVVIKRCEENEDRIRVLESKSDRHSYILPLIERSILWVMATFAAFISYKLGLL